LLRDAREPGASRGLRSLSLGFSRPSSFRRGRDDDDDVMMVMMTWSASSSPIASRITAASESGRTVRVALPPFFSARS